jgi:hypothetical protein
VRAVSRYLKPGDQRAAPPTDLHLRDRCFAGMRCLTPAIRAEAEFSLRYSSYRPPPHECGHLLVVWAFIAGYYQQTLGAQSAYFPTTPLKAGDHRVPERGLTGQ